LPTPLYLEELPLHSPRLVADHLLTEEAIIDFARHWDPQPFHTDHEAAANSIFGELVACAAHLFAIISLLATQDPRPAAMLAGLGGGSTRLPSPGRVGDRLFLRRTYVAARSSASRPDAGVVSQLMELVDATGRLVVAQEGAILVARRPGPPDGPPDQRAVQPPSTTKA
jgi:acyl dehydratase